MHISRLRLVYVCSCNQDGKIVDACTHGIGIPDNVKQVD